MAQTNYAVLFASYPDGAPAESNFNYSEVPSPAPLEDGEVLVRLLFLSVDPYMRGRMRANLQGYFVGPFQVGKPLSGGCVAEVVETKNSSFAVGEIVQGFLEWQLYQKVSKEVLAGSNLVTKVPKIEGISPSTAIGVLGMPGMTAYFGFLDITTPKAGETVVVSGAAGAVGSLVGQIAKIKGCRVVGVAGSEDKVRLIKEKYGFDDGINYKVADNLEKMRAEIKRTCPNGVDIYFDNTGGYISDAVTLELNNFARVSVCGAISTYNEKELMNVTGPRLDFILVTKQVKKEGFLVYRWASRMGEGLTQMAQWIKEGKLNYDETVVKGLENAGKAFIDMMSGNNVGKMVVQI